MMLKDMIKMKQADVCYHMLYAHRFEKMTVFKTICGAHVREILKKSCFHAFIYPTAYIYELAFLDVIC